MTLNFPNPIRRYEAGRSCVSFWGSDASLEVAFQIDFPALRKLNGGHVDIGEASALAIFDQNREVVFKAARAAYGRHPSGFYRLTPESF